MGAQGWSTGAVDCWVGVGNAGTPLFLGHSENGFDVQERPQYENLMCDLTGMKIPYDRSYQGFDAVISSQALTRWDDKVYAALQCYGNPTGAFIGGVQRGTDGAGIRGSLMATEGLTFQVLLRHPNAGALAFAGLAKGYRFYAAVVENDRQQSGAKPYKVNPTFYAWGVYQPATGQVITYDNDVSALGAIS